MARLTVAKAVISGLEHGHTYTLKVQPLVNGTPEGKSGQVVFVTARS